MPEKFFLTNLQHHFEKAKKADFRDKAWYLLSKMGLPSKSHEAFRYVTLREFYLSSFETSACELIGKFLFSESILPECEHSHIIFVNGHFSPELSDITALPPQTALLSLDKALRTHSSFLQSRLSRSLKEEKDPFALLNLALQSEGAFVYVPPKLETAVPLQCLHVLTGDVPQLISPRLHLVLGSNSSMRCILTTHQVSKDVSHCVLPTAEISLEDGANLDILNLIDTMPAWHFETLRAQLKKNAKLNSLSVHFGGKVVRQSYLVQLKGENSEVNLNGLWMLDGRRTAHTHAIVEHEAPHTRSMQRFKGVLGDTAKSSFEGKILVRPEAQKTEAYQINNNLILSQGAIANSKPNLEVFADDVKASHGATVSQLDDEQLFYLSARGIDLFSAKHLLIGGFCREMIDRIPYHSFLQKMKGNVKNFLNKGET